MCKTWAWSLMSIVYFINSSRSDIHSIHRNRDVIICNGKKTNEYHFVICLGLSLILRMNFPFRMRKKTSWAVECKSSCISLNALDTWARNEKIFSAKKMVDTFFKCGSWATMTSFIFMERHSTSSRVCRKSIEGKTECNGNNASFMMFWGDSVWCSFHKHSASIFVHFLRFFCRSDGCLNQTRLSEDHFEWEYTFCKYWLLMKIYFETMQFHCWNDRHLSVFSSSSIFHTQFWHMHRCGQETRVIPRILQLRSHWLKSEKESLRLEEAGITKEVSFPGKNFLTIQWCIAQIPQNPSTHSRWWTVR